MKKKIAICSLFIAAALASCQKNEAPAVSAGEAKNAAPDAKMPAPKGVAPMTQVPAWAESATSNPGLACYLDAINNEGGAGEGKPHRELKIGSVADISGWAIEKSGSGGEQGPAIVVFKSQGDGAPSYYFQANRNERPDVAAAPEFSTLKPTKAGVTVTAGTEGFKPGLYQVEYVVGTETKASRCTLGAPWLVSFVQ